MMNFKILVLTLIPVAFAMDDTRLSEHLRVLLNLVQSSKHHSRDTNAVNRTLASLKNLLHRIPEMTSSSKDEFRELVEGMMLYDTPDISNSYGRHEIHKFVTEHDPRIKKEREAG